MPSRHALTVSLTPELARLVASEVASGRYSSASEVVRAGLRLLPVSLEAQALVNADAIQEAPRHVGLRAVRGAGRTLRHG